MLINISRLIAQVLFFAWLILPGTALAQFNFNDFSDVSSLTLNGDTITTNNGEQIVLRLTNGLSQSGSAFTTNPVSLAGDASFSTFFCFQMTNPQGIGDGDGQGADGIVFVVQTVASNVGGGGGGIGYNGIDDSLGVEFDTFFNGATDPDGNHVGIDFNGSLNSLVTASVTPRLNDGAVWCAWVDYNGVTDMLEVRVDQSSTRPDSAVLTFEVDLVSVLEQTDAFVGFTSGTGGGANDHDILNWQFSPNFDPIGGGEPPELIPVPAAGIYGLALLVALLIALGANNIRRRRWHTT
jgi:hypothetical protein